MVNTNIKMLNLIKEIAAATVREMVPAGFVYGLVTAINPLVIQTESKLPLQADNLILTKNTCLWSVDMDVEHYTETSSGGSGDPSFESHNHAYTGKKTFRVHNELAVGDNVLLGRCEGGQKYIVLDRLYNPDRGCSDGGSAVT